MKNAIFSNDEWSLKEHPGHNKEKLKNVVDVLALGLASIDIDLDHIGHRCPTQPNFFGLGWVEIAQPNFKVLPIWVEKYVGKLIYKFQIMISNWKIYRKIVFVKFI